VFPLVVEEETPLQRLDDLVDRVAKLRHQGYSLRAVASELGISYHKARKIAQAVAA
jgi:orotate phosphoribosyltransferase-like protein